MTGKKGTGGESLLNVIRYGSKGISMALTVDTTAVPHLANRGKTAGKSFPLSQILAPHVIDPDSGFTSTSVGVGCRSVLGRMIAWWGVLSKSELGPAFESS